MSVDESDRQEVERRKGRAKSTCNWKVITVCTSNQTVARIPDISPPRYCAGMLCEVMLHLIDRSD